MRMFHPIRRDTMTRKAAAHVVHVQAAMVIAVAVMAETAGTVANYA